MSSQVRVGLVWKFAFGVSAIVAPLLAYGVTALLIDGRSKSSPRAPLRPPP